MQSITWGYRIPFLLSGIYQVLEIFPKAEIGDPVAIRDLIPMRGPSSIFPSLSVASWTLIF